MFRSVVYALGLAGSLALFAAMPAGAAPLVYLNDGNGQLGQVDPRTGSVGGVVSMQAGGRTVVLTDIAQDPTSGALYGIDFDRTYRIDPATGSLTTLGLHRLPGANGLAFAGDGRLLATGDGSTHLFQLDRNTGAASSLGSIGFESDGDLAFLGDRLFLASFTDGLIQIDDFAADPRGVQVGFMTSNGSRVADVFGLASVDGTLLAFSGTESFVVDTATGELVKLAEFAGKGLGQTFGATVLTPLPLPAAMLFSGFVALAALRMRRNRARRDLAAA